MSEGRAESISGRERMKEVEHRLENSKALSMFKKQRIVGLGRECPRR